ncbi:MAG: fumarylacetoacetate hydrolase family protein [Rhizobiaceae bacterium]|nr:fumarylacetoacetate hydrolase family protein [Rhizobiaceae bacterium]
MKLATYESGGKVRIGSVTPDLASVIDLAAASAGRDNGAFASMQALIEGGDRALDLARRTAEDGAMAGDFLQPLTAVRLLAPLPVPAQIRDFSVFPMHLRQGAVGARKLSAAMAGEPIPDVEPAAELAPHYRERPVYYITNRFSVIGPEAEVRWPRYSRYMDFELEVAAVVSKTGKDIPVERAEEHIFGYTIFNDFSARDAQMLDMAGMLGPTKGKSFDGGNALGPWIVTRDEMPDLDSCKVEARISGRSFHRSNLSGRMFSFPELIAYVTRDETLHAGEVLGSGTVGGCCGLEHFRFLDHGDTIELEVEGIGILRNRVRRQDA